MLINDVEGLLSLYEAANFRVHGEDILEEAFEFCQTHLNESIIQITMTTNASLAKRVDEALKLPIHNTLTLLGVKKFMTWYQQDETQSNAAQPCPTPNSTSCRRCIRKNSLKLHSTT